jgi:ABC-type glycerol-3-phosphate transport system substrate-binding protein
MTGRMRATLSGLALAAFLPAAAGAQTLQILSAEGDPNSVAAMQWVIEDFKKGHPGVDVEYQTVSWTEIGQRIITAIAAGAPPDIVHLDDFAVSVLSDQGILAPADDVIDAIGRDDYFPIPLGAVTFDGTVWGVPFSNGFNLLWYRKDLYEEHGLEPPMTWDALLHNVQTLHGDLPGAGQMYGIALALNNSNHTNDTVQSFMWANGATVLDAEGEIALDSPEAIAAYDYLAELFQYAPPGAAQYGNLEVLNAFATGRVAHTNYPARLVVQVLRTNPELAERTGAVLIPKGPGPDARFASTLYTKAWGFPAAGANIELAKEFVEFLQTGEREVRWLHSVPVHFWPPRRSTATSAAYVENEMVQSPIGKVAQEVILEHALPHAQAQLTEAGRPNTEAFKILQAHVLAELMQKIVLGNYEVERAVEEAVAQSRQLLAN